MTVSNKLSDGKSILVDVTRSKSLEINIFIKKTHFLLLYNIKVIVVCESFSVRGEGGKFSKHCKKIQARSEPLDPI